VAVMIPVTCKTDGGWETVPLKLYDYVQTTFGFL
jgi:hypothetical protein